MEVKQLLTSGRINLYFGGADRLENEEHFEAFCHAIIYALKLIEPIVDGIIEISAKKPLRYHGVECKESRKGLQKIWKCKLNLNLLFLDDFLHSLYNLEINEVELISPDGVKMLFSFDPIIVNIQIGE